ncbi:uncharacterized protein [Elaeis guineensis]|uniref:uncharacterized protein n=1 Tax=Elaeis guineensis var. tenera TaxID=51953 RepID=UPI003C6CE00E
MAAANGSSLSVTQFLIPIFKGASYEFWKIKMRTFFLSHDLWELVESGYAEPNDGGVNLFAHQRNELKENRKKDSKALLVIQQAVDESIFSRIVAATKSQKAWMILEKEYQGSDKVKIVKLQGLRRDFETLFMKSSESVHEFFARVLVVVNQTRAMGENLSD